MSTFEIEIQAMERAFKKNTDLTVGIEEEFQIMDPETLELTPGFDKLVRNAFPSFKRYLAPELIKSEIELTSKPHETFSQLALDLKEKRKILMELANSQSLLLSSNATHPFSKWQDQEIVDVHHYHKVEKTLGYAAWRNNTFGFHLHIGVSGPDRAIKLADRMRTHLPTFLALSASSPFVEGRDTYLHSARTQLFTKNFPRCGLPDTFGSWENYRNYLSFLHRTNSATLSQVWWSIRPHHKHGTVEIRICDGQPKLDHTLAIASLIVAVAAKTLDLIDDDHVETLPPYSYLEENFWRAIRFGLEGKLIDYSTMSEVETRETVAYLWHWTERYHRKLGLNKYLEPLVNLIQEGNWAIRQRQMLNSGLTFKEIHQYLSSVTMGFES